METRLRHIELGHNRAGGVYGEGVHCASHVHISANLRTVLCCKCSALLGLPAMRVFLKWEVCASEAAKGFVFLVIMVVNAVFRWKS